MKRILLSTTLLLGAGPALAQVGGACTAINTVNFCVTETNDGVQSTSAGLNDEFGAALAFGDFNGDGFKDLAVGVPGENGNTGAVHIYNGSRSNVRIAPLVFDQTVIPGQSRGFDERFGQSLAAGDFDGDGIDDLAVSAPEENTGQIGCGFGSLIPCRDDGVVHVFSGQPGGLDLQGGLTLDADDLGLFVAGDIEHGLHVGQSLGAGDLDGDGIAELIIGAPDTESLVTERARGIVVVLQGSPSGFVISETMALPNRIQVPQGGSILQHNRLGDGPIAVATLAGTPQLILGNPFYDEQSVSDAGVVWLYRFDANLRRPHQMALQVLLRQTSFGLAGQADQDHFGSALATGDFNGDGFVDIAVGAPDRDLPKPIVGSYNDAGRIYVSYGSATGLNLANIQVINESFFPNQSVDANEGFGAALAAGDISGDGIDDLLIGAPGEGAGDSGYVYFLVGSPQRLQVASGGSPIFSGGYIFSQGTIGSSNQDEDLFGSVLAVADPTGDGQAEIAIGVPQRDHSSKLNAGQVYVTRRMQIAPQ